MNYDKQFCPVIKNQNSYDLIFDKCLTVRMEVDRNHTSKRASITLIYENPSLSEGPRYCPFRTPIIQPRFTNSRMPQKSCRVLFEQDQDSVLNAMDINTLQNNSPTNADGILLFGKLIQKEKKNHNGLIRSSEMKENQISTQSFSFNTRMRVKYPQTPIFKKFLESPITHFNRMFQPKIELLKNQVKRKTAIVPLELMTNPLQFKQSGYKFFMCLAELFKKSQAVSQCRAFYKISVYLQPYDESTWEWILKFQEQLGCLELAYNLCKTAVMFMKNQNIILKYLKLADKCQKPISEIRGVLGQTSLKLEQSSKIYLQLAKLENKCGNIQTACKICFYLLQETEGNSNIIMEACKILQISGLINQAIDILFKSIDKGCKAYSVYVLYLNLLESVYFFSNQHIQYVLTKAEKALPQQVLWKFILDTSRYYMITNQHQPYLQLLKRALIAAPVNAKFKPYISISKSIGQRITNPKNSALAIECNKQALLNGNITFYNFSQWKHYLHYSLFYIFYGNQEARSRLESASIRWPYAGRLWAEILWVKRVSKEQTLSKWKQIIIEVPKSGQVWCEGGRIYIQLGDLQSAMFCFQAAIHLTPQYGDSFIEAMNVLMFKGKYKQLKILKRKIMNAQPFYGNVWCFLKDHSRSSTIQIYRKAKHLIKQQLYRSGGCLNKRLTAIQQYNYVFQHPQLVTEAMKEKIICGYDQLENTRC